MRRKEDSDVNRRKFMKRLGTSAGAIAISSGLTAAKDEKADVLTTDEAVAILSEAGDPEVISTSTKHHLIGDSNSMVQTKVQTDVGILTYTEFEEAIEGEEVNVQFHFDELDGTIRRKIPERFKKVPSNTTLMLVHWENEVYVRRTATKNERRFLVDTVEIEVSEDENVMALYCEKLGGFYLIIEREGETERYAIKESTGATLPFDQRALSSLRTRELTIDTVTQDVGIQASDCDISSYLPCYLCVGSTGACAICAPSCAATIGATCIACIYGCGVATYNCTCCLKCYDSVNEPC